MEAPILFRFVVTVAVLPFFVVLTRRLRDVREYIPLAVAFYLLCGAEAATVIERVFDVEVMDYFQHALYAGAGIAACVGSVMVSWRVFSERTAP